MDNPEYRYVGKLIIDSEGSIVEDDAHTRPRPAIKCISWSSCPLRHGPAAQDVIAVTGEFGTYVYFRPSAPGMRKTMDNKWEKLFAWPDLKGESCIWNPSKTTPRGDEFVGSLAVIIPATATTGGKIHMIDGRLDNSRRRNIYDARALNSVTSVCWISDGLSMIVFQSASDQIHTMRWVKERTKPFDWVWSRFFLKYGNESSNSFGCCPTKNSLVFAACSIDTPIQVYRWYSGIDGGSATHWKIVDEGKGPVGLKIIKMAFSAKGEQLAALSEHGAVYIFSVKAPENDPGSLTQITKHLPAVPKSVNLHWSSAGFLILHGDRMTATRYGPEGVREKLISNIIKQNKGKPPYDTIKLVAQHPERPHIIAMVGHNDLIFFWQNGRSLFKEVDRDLVYERFFDHVPPHAAEHTPSSNQLNTPEQKLVDNFVAALREKGEFKNIVKMAYKVLRPHIQKVFQGERQKDKEWSIMAQELFEILRIAENLP